MWPIGFCFQCDSEDYKKKSIRKVSNEENEKDIFENEILVKVRRTNIINEIAI